MIHDHQILIRHLDKKMFSPNCINGKEVSDRYEWSVLFECFCDRCARRYSVFLMFGW